MTRRQSHQKFAKTMSPQASTKEEPLEELPFVTYERAVSFGVSVLFHSFLVLLLAVFAFYYSSESQPVETLHVQMDSIPEPKPRFVEEMTFEVLKTSDDTDARILQQDARELANASPPPIAMALFSHRGGFPATARNGWGGNALAGLGEKVDSRTVAGKTGKSDGEVNFFGTKAKGNSFVFIVDCSGSMTIPTNYYHPRIKGPITRFVRARQELYLSLGQLARNQKFYVIFYNHDTFPMLYPNLQDDLQFASPNNLKTARNWIQNVLPGGGTDPRDAFQIALALRPQVIFFLTDGAIPAETRAVAKAGNKSRTRIHTIAFGLPQNHAVLKGIASDNLGRFRYVP